MIKKVTRSLKSYWIWNRTYFKYEKKVNNFWTYIPKLLVALYVVINVDVLIIEHLELVSQYPEFEWIFRFVESWVSYLRCNMGLLVCSVFLVDLRSTSLILNNAEFKEEISALLSPSEIYFFSRWVGVKKGFKYVGVGLSGALAIDNINMSVRRGPVPNESLINNAVKVGFGDITTKEAFKNVTQGWFK